MNCIDDLFVPVTDRDPRAAGGVDGGFIIGQPFDSLIRCPTKNYM